MKTLKFYTWPYLLIFPQAKFLGFKQDKNKNLQMIFNNYCVLSPDIGTYYGGDSVPNSQKYAFKLYHKTQHIILTLRHPLSGSRRSAKRSVKYVHHHFKPGKIYSFFSDGFPIKNGRVLHDKKLINHVHHYVIMDCSIDNVTLNAPYVDMINCKAYPQKLHKMIKKLVNMRTQLKAAKRKDSQQQLIRLVSRDARKLITYSNYSPATFSYPMARYMDDWTVINFWGWMKKPLVEERMITKVTGISVKKLNQNPRLFNKLKSKYAVINIGFAPNPKRYCKLIKYHDVLKNLTHSIHDLKTKHFRKYWF